MKFAKKRLFVTALSVSLIAILSMGSLAWFSATDSVLNEFKVADSEDDTPDEIFSVDVWEHVDTNSDDIGGDAGVGPDAGGNTSTYTDILPGDKLMKIVHVTNTGHYDQYIRVIVEISDADVWLNVLGDTQFNDATLAACFGGFDINAWNNITTQMINDTIRVVMYYKEALAGGDDIVVFETVNVPTAMTQEQAVALEGGFTVKVKAQAVQTENVGTDAYEAFQTVGMTD